MFGKYKINTLLVLAPHTDDGEIGCGGLISLAVEQGVTVYYVAFSSARISLPKDAPADTLITEVKAATKILGIPEDNVILFDYPTRRMPEFRQDILDDMISLRERLKPDLILTPSLNDIHQDHHTVAHETLRCFKKQSILCYEEPWNNIAFASQCFVKLDERHIEKKIQALQCYESQKRRTYLTEDSIRSMAKMRGTQLEGGYAEAFEVVRWMI